MRYVLRFVFFFFFALFVCDELPCIFFVPSRPFFPPTGASLPTLDPTPGFANFVDFDMSPIYFSFLVSLLGWSHRGFLYIFGAYSFFSCIMFIGLGCFFFGVRYTTYSFNSGEHAKAAQDFLFSFTVHSLESVRLLDGIWLWTAFHTYGWRTLARIYTFVAHKFSGLIFQ